MKYLHVGANPDRFLIITAAVFGLIWMFNSWKLGRFRRSRDPASQSVDTGGGRKQKLWPLFMILLGIAQIVMGIMEIRMPILTGIIGILFLLWGIQILRSEKKQRMGKGQDPSQQ